MRGDPTRGGTSTPGLPSLGEEGTSVESPSSPQLWVPLSEPPGPRRVGSRTSAQHPALGHT